MVLVKMLRDPGLGTYRHNASKLANRVSCWEEAHYRFCDVSCRVFDWADRGLREGFGNQRRDEPSPLLAMVKQGVVYGVSSESANSQSLVFAHLGAEGSIDLRD